MTSNKREATLRLTRPLRRDVDMLRKQVRAIEKRVDSIEKRLTRHQNGA